MGSNRCTITVDTSEVISNLKDMDKRVQVGLKTIGESVGAQMKAYAQTNRKWTDRSGDARKFLEYDVKWEDTTLDISVFHQMEYGYWLEVAMNERFAILQEARDSQVEVFKQAIKAMKL